MTSAIKECCSVTCRWIGGILANLVFVTGMVLGAVYTKGTWPVSSFVVSLVYIGVLYIWIARLSKAIENGDSTEADAEEQELSSDEGKQKEGVVSNDCVAAAHQEEGEPSELDNSSTRVKGVEKTSRRLSTRVVPVGLSLLYGTFTLALGTPGAFLSLGGLMSQCRGHRSYRQHENTVRPKPTWKTNVTSLPQEIQEWKKAAEEEIRKAKDDRWSHVVRHQTYARLDTTLYFQGSLDTDQMLLVSNGTGVHTVRGSYERPIWITSVANQYLCFVNTKYRTLVSADRDCDFYGVHLVYCGSDEVGFQQIELENGIFPKFLTGIGGLLWLLFTYPISGPGGDEYKEANGNAIVSLDPATMEMTFHSVLEQPLHVNITDATGAIDEEDTECIRFGVSWYGAISFLLLSSVPVVVSSAWLWAKRGIPSSSIALLLGVCLCLVSIASIFGQIWSRTWAALATALPPKFLFCAFVWILMSTYVLAVSRGVARAPFLWALYFASFGIFTVVAHQVATLQYEQFKRKPQYDTDDWFEPDLEDDPTFLFFSVLAIVVFYIPLSIVGIINDSTSIFIMAVVGIMLDIGMGTGLALRSRGVLTTGAVVTLEIIFLMALSWRVFRRHTREVIRTRMVSYMTSCARRISETHSSAVLDGDDEEETRESLLGTAGGNNTEEEIDVTVLT